MRHSYKYIFSLFIALSIIGAGEGIIRTSYAANILRQTEVVAGNDRAEKVSKSFHFSLNTLTSVPQVCLQTWSDELITIYNSKITVKYLAQSAIFRGTCFITPMFYIIYIPEDSAENHLISLSNTESSVAGSFSCAVMHNNGIMVNNLLSRKWTKQKENSSDTQLYSGGLQNGSGDGFTLFSQPA